MSFKDTKTNDNADETLVKCIKKPPNKLSGSKFLKWIFTIIQV